MGKIHLIFQLGGVERSKGTNAEFFMAKGTPRGKGGASKHGGPLKTMGGIFETKKRGLSECPSTFESGGTVGRGKASQGGLADPSLSEKRKVMP